MELKQIINWHLFHLLGAKVKLHPPNNAYEGVQEHRLGLSYDKPYEIVNISAIAGVACAAVIGFSTWGITRFDMALSRFDLIAKPNQWAVDHEGQENLYDSLEDAMVYAQSLTILEEGHELTWSIMDKMICPRSNNKHRYYRTIADFGIRPMIKG